MKYYTKMEVDIMIKNNKKIVLVKNNIYDVTEFIHPFGIDPFNSNKIGADISNDYNFHSDKSKNIWKKYKIGELYSKCNCIIT